MSGELPEPEPERTIPAPAPARDYGDEIPSQRRARWMTQVMVMPFLVGGLYGFSYLLGWWLGAYQHRLAAESWRLALIAGVIALPSYFMVRGKIGSRRRWLNFTLLAACLGIGGLLGWRAGSLKARPPIGADPGYDRYGS
jgi:hypothetical protein